MCYFSNFDAVTCFLDHRLNRLNGLGNWTNHVKGLETGLLLVNQLLEFSHLSGLLQAVPFLKGEPGGDLGGDGRLGLGQGNALHLGLKWGSIRGGGSLEVHIYSF